MTSARRGLRSNLSAGNGDSGGEVLSSASESNTAMDVIEDASSQENKKVQLSTLIQLIWQESVVPEELFRALDINVAQLNASLAPFHFKVAKYLNNYVLVNTLKDEIAINFSCKYDEFHRSIFLHMMKILAEDEDHRVKVDDAIMSARSDIKTLPKSTSNSQIRDAISKFVHDEWLHVIYGSEYLVLSPRSLVELKEYFLQDSGANLEGLENEFTLQSCGICHNLTAHDGISCHSCGERVHLFCIGKVKRCISCKEIILQDSGELRLPS